MKGDLTMLITPRRGDVLFFAPDSSNAIDREIIKAQQRAGFPEEVVHCEGVLDDGYFSVGAIWPAIRIGPIRLLFPSLIVSPPYPGIASARLDAAEYLAKQIGVHYNAPGAILSGVAALLPAWKQALTGPAADLERHWLFCSQTMMGMLLAGHIDVPTTDPFVRPAEVLRFLRSIGSTEQKG